MDRLYLRRWGVPWRPIELEALSFALVVTGLLYPLLIPDLLTATAAAEHRHMMVGLVWDLAMIGGFIAYLAHQQTTVDRNSTPAFSLFAPLLFGGLCYGNVLYASQAKGVTLPLVNGGWGQLIGYPLVLLGILMLMARLRTLRRLLRYRGIKWDLEVDPVMDRSFIVDLGRAVLPLAYGVRKYRFCEEGILIIGFHYLCAIPFRAIESIEEVGEFSPVRAATYYAASSRSLIQLQLNDHPEPIMIGPKQHDEVLHYCEHHDSEHLVVSRRKYCPRPEGERRMRGRKTIPTAHEVKVES